MSKMSYVRSIGDIVLSRDVTERDLAASNTKLNFCTHLPRHQTCSIVNRRPEMPPKVQHHAVISFWPRLDVRLSSENRLTRRQPRAVRREPPGVLHAPRLQKKERTRQALHRRNPRKRQLQRPRRRQLRTSFFFLVPLD